MTPAVMHWMNMVCQSALSNRATLNATYAAALAAIQDHIPGDFVECGVYAGAQIAAMAQARAVWQKSNGATDSSRLIQAFDSFAGIPAGGEHDAGWIHPEGTSACTLALMQKNIVDWGLDITGFRFHAGLFSETVPRAISRKDFPRGIAVLRLDGDLYSSTKDCMPLIALVNPGGWIIVDDFDLAGCRKAILEEMETGMLTGPVYFRKQVQ